LLKPTTRADYQRILDKYILPGLGEKRLSHLRRLVFDQYYLSLVEQGMGKTYVYYVHRVLHKALGDAVDDRLINYNPTVKAKLPRLERRRRRRSPLTMEETNRLVQTAMQTPLGPLIYVAVKTGMREGELFALQWEDIDWQQRQVHVRRNVQRIRENGKAVVVFTTPKSEAGNRIINVGPATLKVLQQQLETVALLRALSKESWQEHNLVFPSTVGTPRNPSNLRKHYNQLLAAAGVPKITFHDLRHMAASIMLNNGVPVLVASHILGHAQPSTTMNMYGHEFTDQEIKAAEMMDQVVPQPDQPILVGELVKVRDLQRTH
jgi:integrase